jgi:hypothetical protein
MSASSLLLKGVLEHRRALSLKAGTTSAIKRILRRKDRREASFEVEQGIYYVMVGEIKLDELPYPIYGKKHWCWDIGCHHRDWRPYRDYEI